MTQITTEELRSVFETRTVEDIYDEICDLYLQFPQPWVIGYSGGKDSTTVLQLIWKALERLPAEKRQKGFLAVDCSLMESRTGESQSGDARRPASMVTV